MTEITEPTTLIDGDDTWTIEVTKPASVNAVKLNGEYQWATMHKDWASYFDAIPLFTKSYSPARELAAKYFRIHKPELFI